VCVEWTGIYLNIRFVLERQDKFKMIEFGANLMLVTLTYAVIKKADLMTSAGTPEVGVTALEFVILQVPGPVSWRQSARDPALLR